MELIDLSEAATPGPWKVGTGPSSSAAVLGQGGFVANCGNPTGGREFGNAAFIAYAPEMVDLLRLFVQLFDHPRYDMWGVMKFQELQLRYPALRPEVQKSRIAFDDDTDDDEQFATTSEAAAFLKFEPQTLRRWACRQVGPIQPLRIGKRLRWRWADLRKLAEVGEV